MKYLWTFTASHAPFHGKYSDFLAIPLLLTTLSVLECNDN